VGMLRELAAPGRQDTRKTGESSAEEAGIAGEALEGCRRRLDHGLGGQPGLRAAEGAQGFREGKGEEEGRSWELLVELLGEPLPRLLGLTLGTRAIAAGMRETVVLSTALAGRKAGAVGGFAQKVTICQVFLCKEAFCTKSQSLSFLTSNRGSSWG
jgi:hypothetical protein